MIPRPDRKRNRPIEVLVVDDSAVVRTILQKILGQHGRMNVTVAADPILAQEKMKRLRPDVIVLDLEMPKMDGLTFLRKIMREDPIPVVVCSSLAGPNTETALQAIDEGAAAIVTKPKLGVQDFMVDSAQRLIDTVEEASQVHRVRRNTPPAAFGSEAIRAAAPLPFRMTTNKVVAVGASTGGTEALRLLLESMPPDCPGIVIVQHMPEGFTRQFAMRLNLGCRIAVKEAEDGDPITPGRALIAQGNKHLEVKRSGAQYFASTYDGPPVSRHRPSVDVLFRSVAQSAGSNAVGVLLTGMGADGADGLLWMRQAGASTIAQDEATSVVWGMPKEAIERGAAELVLPMPEIARAILKKAAG